MEKVLYTDAQLSRMKRNKEIIASFKALRRANPDASPERIFATIAQNYELGSAAIRQICRRSGVYVNGKTDN